MSVVSFHMQFGGASSTMCLISSLAKLVAADSVAAVESVIFDAG